MVKSKPIHVMRQFQTMPSRHGQTGASASVIELFSRMSPRSFILSGGVRVQSENALDADQWNSRIECGLVQTSTITRSEIGFSTHSVGPRPVDRGDS